MPFPKFTASFALAGFLVPLIFRAGWSLINKSGYLNIHIIAEKLMLLLWPASLMTLPASSDPEFEVKLFLLSLAANVILYTVLGMLVWLGLRKHVGFFAIAGIPLVAIWWWLLTR